MPGFDELWIRLRNILAFVCGMGIMVYETIGDNSDRPWLYAAAVGMMGLPIAREAERVIGRLSATGTTGSMEPPTHPEEVTEEPNAVHTPKEPPSARPPPHN